MKNKIILMLRDIKYLPMRIKYKLLGLKFGNNFIVGKSVNIETEGFIAGKNVYIGQYSYIAPNSKLGNYCMLADNVNIIGHDHNFEEVGTPIILSGKPQEDIETILNDDVWIGHGVTIMRGISIGEGSIIGANSVVTKDIPEYSIYAGVPAKFIRKRFKNDDERLNHSQKLQILGDV